MRDVLGDDPTFAALAEAGKSGAVHKDVWHDVGVAGIQ